MGILLQTVLWMVIAMIVMAVGAIVALDLWGKKATGNKILGVFLEARKLSSHLMDIEGDRAYLGKGDKREMYALDSDKQFWAGWPAGLPSILQVPVRAHLYIRNRPEPVDPKDPQKGMTSNALMMVSDEAMLRSTWHDVREAAGGTVASGMQGARWIIWIVVANLIVSGFAIYMIMDTQTKLGLTGPGVGG